MSEWLGVVVGRERVGGCVVAEWCINGYVGEWVDGWVGW